MEGRSSIFCGLPGRREEALCLEDKARLRPACRGAAGGGAGMSRVSGGRSRCRSAFTDMQEGSGSRFGTPALGDVAAHWVLPLAPMPRVRTWSIETETGYSGEGQRFRGLAVPDFDVGRNRPVVPDGGANQSVRQPREQSAPPCRGGGGWHPATLLGEGGQRMMLRDDQKTFRRQIDQPLANPSFADVEDGHIIISRYEKANSRNDAGNRHRRVPIDQRE